MSEANKIQVGGSHYNRMKYQHWDFMLDMEECGSPIGWLLGCATKYISRWRYKNGKQDLEKAKHYLSKSLEQDHHFVVPRNMLSGRAEERYISKFGNQLDLDDHEIILLCLNGKINSAIVRIDVLIEELDEGDRPGPTYVNPDQEGTNGSVAPGM